MPVGANQIRIIGGRHRGRKLRFHPVPGLRPTADRVRETLFNWLRADVSGARCLDLFAGSGALGFEALSRGAGHLVSVEWSRPVAERLRRNLMVLSEDRNVDVVQKEARRFLETGAEDNGGFDIVFLDPPFAAGLLAETAALLEEREWLASGSCIYLEQDRAHPWPDLPPSWRLDREGNAGQAAFRLYRRD